MRINIIAEVEAGDSISITPLSVPDIRLLDVFLEKKAVFEQKKGRRLPVNITIDLPYQKKTYSQLKTIWLLITLIFQSMEGRKPTEKEKYRLYLDLLEEYGVKEPGPITGRLIPRRVSEADTREAAVFIEGLLCHLAQEVSLPLELQADVRCTLYRWQAWRGTLPDDPLDEVTEKEWRDTHVYSEASGLGGIIELAHIVSRKRAPACKDAPWNWIALTAEEHRDQHQHGWNEFLQKYPHLRGRVERALKRAYKLEELNNGVET
jgi:hypothetical protein